MPKLLLVSINNTKMEYKKFLKTHSKEVNVFRKIVSNMPEIKDKYGSINWRLIVPEKQRCIEKVASSLDISPKFISSMFIENDRLEAAGATHEVLVSQMGQYLRFTLSKTHEDYVELSQCLIKLFFEELDKIIENIDKKKKFKLF